MASASITFIEIDTNVMTKTQSDETGNYASPPLRPGNYRVIAGAPGFKTQTRSEITLKVQDRLRLDFDNGTAAEWTRLYPACDVEYGSGPHQFRDQRQLGRQQYRRTEQFCSEWHSRDFEQFHSGSN